MTKLPFPRLRATTDGHYIHFVYLPVWRACDMTMSIDDVDDDNEPTCSTRAPRPTGSDIAGRYILGAAELI